MCESLVLVYKFFIGFGLNAKFHQFWRYFKLKWKIICIKVFLTTRAYWDFSIKPSQRLSQSKKFDRARSFWSSLPRAKPAKNSQAKPRANLRCGYKLKIRIFCLSYDSGTYTVIDRFQIKSLEHVVFKLVLDFWANKLRMRMIIDIKKQKNDSE